MITRKRINNDIFIRWAIFKPDNTPEDFSNATIKYVRAKAKGDGSIYDLTYEIDGHILDIQFPANKQKILVYIPSLWNTLSQMLQ